MLINFALDAVGTTITCDKVSTDGYECSNLVSSVLDLRRKGFIVEHFIKPPVNLTFKFPCNVLLHHIIVKPCVGQQRSSHLQLYSASKPFRIRFCNRQAVVAETKKGDGEVEAATASTTSPIFYPVSPVSVPDCDQICFYNPSAVNSSDRDTGSHVLAYTCRQAMNHPRLELVRAASHLMLRLVRTSQGSAAALGGIQIWGLPALSLPVSVYDNIVSRYHSFLNQNSNTKHLEPEKVQESEVATAAEHIDNFEVPEEFLDPLTYEVMTIPILLPSGQTVDQSSLDRYFQAEASFGRQPKDPFTGVAFTAMMKPVPNGALKSRIDKFLMDHASNSQTSAIPRTVSAGGHVSILGKRKTSDPAFGISKLIVEAVEQPILDSGDETNDTLQNEAEVNQVGTGYGGKKVTRVPKINKNVAEVSLSLTNVKQKTPFNAESSSAGSSQMPTNSLEKSHDKKLTSSLNSALSSVFSNLPSYSCDGISSEKFDVCSMCTKTLLLHTISYLTPCSHFICRECLTSNCETSVTCGCCGHIVNKRDVSRRHQTISF